MATNRTWTAKSLFDSFFRFLRKRQPVGQRRRAARPLVLEILEDRTVPTTFTVVNTSSDPAVVGSLPWAVAQAAAIPAASTFANINAPYGLTMDAGNVYVSDSADGAVSQVTPTGVVNPYASGLSIPAGMAFDSAGNLYVACTGTNAIDLVSPNGAVNVFATGFDNPSDLAFDAAGNLYVSNAAGNTVNKITFSAPGVLGAVSTFASGFNHPEGLAFDASNNLYVANTDGYTISEVSPAGVVSTLVPYEQADLDLPSGLAFDGRGNLYVKNTYSISEVTFAAPGVLGSVSTYVDYTQGLVGQGDLAFDGHGNLYAVNQSNNNLSMIVPPTPNLGPSIIDFADGPGQTFATAQTITLTQTLDLNNATPGASIEIGGPTAALTIDAPATGSAIAVQEGATATLAGLTITNGNGAVFGAASEGGGIFNDGNLTLNGCTVSNCSAEYGGGILNNSSGALTVTNSTITGNSSDSHVEEEGGGIANWGTLTLSSSVLANNSDINGQPSQHGVYGGGLFLSGTTPVNVSYCTFSGNTSCGDGGAIFNDGSPLTVTNCTFTGNSVLSPYRGGAINTGSFGAATTVIDSTFTNNSATEGGAIVNGSGYAGYPAPVLTLIDCTITGNSATLGGGIYNGDVYGGTHNGSLLLENTIVAADSASSGPDIYNLDDDSATYSMIGATSGSGIASGNGNILNPTSLGLGTLSDNGGPTKTIALLPGSPAIDAGDPSAPWIPAASMNTARYVQTETVLTNGDVLVAGGVDSNGNALASAELYDPVTNTWSSAGAMATPRYHDTATLLQNGDVLVAGGFDGTNYLASAELYDPTTNSWSSAGSMATPRFEHTATLLNDGAVLIAGGYDGNALASAELYDPVSNSWSSTGAMASPRDSHTATLLGNGKVLVTGGYDLGVLSSAELYDPTTKTWSAAAPLTTGRYFQAATLLGNGKVLVTGGFNPDNNNAHVLASAELYDPASNTWSSAGSMATGRAYQAALLLSDGQVLVAGGFDGSNALATTELYDPASNTWTTGNPMNTARTDMAAAVLATGEVLVTGGYGGSALSSAELYELPANDQRGPGFARVVNDRIDIGAFEVQPPVASAPTLTGPTATAITTTTATLGGDVTSDGGAAITNRGILYALTSANTDPMLGGANVTEVDDANAITGDFTESITGLAVGTAYTYVAFATNSVGTTYTTPVATFTTAHPTVVSVTPSIATIADAQAGANGFRVSVAYSTAMNAGVAPTISFSPAVGTTLTFVSGSWNAGQTIYTALFNVAAAGVSVPSVAVTVNGAQATDGAVQVSFTQNSAFAIDTTNPTVTSITPSAALITEGQVGSKAFSLSIAFSEAMNRTVAPSISFGVPQGGSVSPTLTFASGSWNAAGTIYTAVYNVVNVGATVPSIAVEVINAQGANGNSQVGITQNAVFAINTLDPAVTSVSPSLTAINDASTSLHLAITYGVAMNRAIAPTISFSPSVSTTLALASGSWNTAGTIYTTVYNVALAKVNVSSVGVTVSGAKDTHGNSQLTLNQSGVFAIDTTNPTVTALTPSTVVVADPEVGKAGWTLAIQYSAAMSPAVAPTISFSPAVSTTLTFASGSWNAAATIYTAAYNVANANLSVPAVAVTVSGAKKANGNLQTPLTQNNVFAIDTVSPIVTAITPSVPSVAAAQIGAATFSLAIQFNAAMNPAAAPTISFNPSLSPTVVVTTGSGNLTHATNTGTPIVLNGNPSLSTTLTLASGSWNAADTVYTATYHVAGTGTSLAGVAVTVRGAQKADGNLQTAKSQNAVFGIDTVVPTITKATPTAGTIAVAQVGAGTFKLAVQYSTVMNAVAPTIAFSPSIGSTLTFASGSWNSVHTIFTAVFNVANAKVSIASVGVTISGAQNVHGNIQTAFTQNSLFAIDTVSPTVTSITPSVATITDAQMGATGFSVAVAYSVPMNAALAPTISFSPDVSSVLTFAFGSWNAAQTLFTATYSVSSTAVQIPAVAITVSGGANQDGNVQTLVEQINALAIDTVSPTVKSVTPSVATITNAQVGANGFTLSVTFSAAMDPSVAPAISFSPNIGSTLTFASGSWNAGHTIYTASFNVADAAVSVSSIEVTISDGRGSDDNLQVPFDRSAIFGIATV